MSADAGRWNLLQEAKRRKKLYPTTAALRLAGLWFPVADPIAALRRALDEVIAFLPVGLLALFVAHPRGFVIVVPQVPAGLQPRRSCYLEGGVTIGGRTFDNVACILGTDLAGGEGVGQHEVAHLLDHLLGSDGRREGIYLSEGGGTTPALQEQGQRLQALYRERPRGGYMDWIGPRGYLARAVQAYCVQPMQLKADDPAMHRFLKSVFLSERYWGGPNERPAAVSRAAEDASGW